MYASFKPRTLTRAAILLLVTVALLPVAAGHLLAGDEETVIYGEGVQKGKVLRLDELMKDQDAYLDKVVRVEGTITDVCQHMGCWIDIQDDAQRTIRFKVKDGVIVFPTDVKGRHAQLEGRLWKKELTGEDAIAWARHEAMEKGEEFDPATVEDPLIVLQLEGIGAVVSTTPKKN